MHVFREIFQPWPEPVEGRQNTLKKTRCFACPEFIEEAANSFKFFPSL